MPNLVLARAATPGLVIALALAACDRSAPSVMGPWTSADAADRWTLEMESDSTFVMQIGDMAGAGTFTAEDEEGWVRMRPTGDLARLRPDGFRAIVQGDTLRLCDPVDCTDMVRVQTR